MTVKILTFGIAGIDQQWS